MEALALSTQPGLDTYGALARSGSVPARRGEPDPAVSRAAEVALAGVADIASLSGRGFADLQSRQAVLNELALTLRQETGRVEIRKLFPPYPPEQAERMAFLDDISGLRRQIEALTPVSAQAGETLDLGEADQAEQASLLGRRMLAGLTSGQALSTNRPLLEGVAQSDPLI